MNVGVGGGVGVVDTVSVSTRDNVTVVKMERLEDTTADMEPSTVYVPLSDTLMETVSVTTPVQSIPLKPRLQMQVHEG